MEFWHHHFFSQLKKHTNAKFEKKYHFIKFYREFWAILEVSDITKGDTIITFWNSDTFIGFLTPKNICIRILRWKQVILSLFIMFYCFYYVFSDSLTIFGSLGFIDVTKWVKIMKYGMLPPSSVFSPQKYIHTNFRWKQ